MSRKYILAFVCLILSIGTSCAFAVNEARYYVGPDNGLWSDPNNWSLTDGGPGGAGLPLLEDYAFIQGAVSRNIIFDASYVNNDLRFTSVTTTASSATMTITQASNSALRQNYLYLGPGSDYVQSAGSDFANTMLEMTGTATQLAQYHLSGGALTGTIDRKLANASFFQSGGSNSTLNEWRLNANANVFISGGSFSCDHFTASGNNSGFHLSGGTLISGFLGTISNGAIIEQDAGTYNASAGNITSLSIDGTSSYNLRGGNFNANGTVSVGGQLIQSGGTASIRKLQNNALFALSPAASATIDTLIDAGTATISLELDGTSPSQFAHILTTTSAQLDGNLTVNLGPNFTPQLGDSFNVITGPSITGTFSSYTLPPLSSGLTWVVNQTPTVFNLSVATPEPILAGLLPPLALLRRSRRKGNPLRERGRIGNHFRRR